MFIHYRTPGFVLKENEKGEADKVFTIFTKDLGRIEVLGKGIRKMESKLRSGVPLFSLTKIEFIQGKNYKTLTDAILLDDFEEIKKDPEKLKISFRIAETFTNLVKPPQEDEGIWNLLGEIFNGLNQMRYAVDDIQLFYQFFFWRLLPFLGYQPELYHCLDCGKRLVPRHLFFSSRGGIVCGSCRDQEISVDKEIRPNAIKVLREVLRRDLRGLSKIKIGSELNQEIEEISDFYLQFLLS